MKPRNISNAAGGMNGNSVLLLRLYEKTSAKGNAYFAGRMGQASAVMMRDLHAEGDDPVWQLFVSEPRQAAGEAQPAQKPAFGRHNPCRNGNTPKRASRPVPAGELDDDMPEIG